MLDYRDLHCFLYLGESKTLMLKRLEIRSWGECEVHVLNTFQWQADFHLTGNRSGIGITPTPTVSLLLISNAAV